jgi:hypothetical protein
LSLFFLEASQRVFQPQNVGSIVGALAAESLLWLRQGQRLRATDADAAIAWLATISGRGLAGAVLRRGAVKVAGAFFEGADHAADRFAEQDLDQPLQQT